MVNLQANDSMRRIEDRGSTSGPMTLANMLKGFIGAGIIGLPGAFANSGLAAGIVSMAALSVLSIYCILLLLDCLDPEGDKVNLNSERMGLLATPVSKMRASFEEIGEAAFGKFGRTVVQAVLMFTQVGFCCVYVIFLGQNLFTLIFDEDASKSHKWMLFSLIFLAFLIAVCLLRSLKYLAYVSLIGQTTIFSGLGVVFILCVISLVKHGVGDGGSITQMNVNSYPLFFGTAAYVFEGIGIIIPLQRAMKNPDNFVKVLNVNFLITTIAYIGFGVVGYLAFGSNVMSPITGNLNHSIFSKVVTGTLIVGIFCTYPIQMVPVFTITENGLFNPQTPNLELKRTVLRTCLCIFTFAAAFAIPHFGLFMDLIGALGCSTLAYIMPAVFHLKLRKTSIGFTILHILIAIFGVVAMLVSTAMTIRDIIKTF